VVPIVNDEPIVADEPIVENEQQPEASPEEVSQIVED